MTLRVLMIQRIIPHYRIPLFERLGNEFDFTVAHSVPSPVPEDAPFESVLVPDRILAGLHWQVGVAALARQADVVIAEFNLRMVSSVWSCLTRSNQRFIWFGHGFGHSRLGRPAAAWLSRRADATILYDEAQRREFQEAGTDPAKLFVAPNTIHVPDSGPCDDADDRKSFLYVGRLQERKRVDLLIDAFAKVADQLPEEVGLDIVGNGDLRAALDAQIASAGLTGRVRTHGEVVDPTELKVYFHRAIAYVSPGDVGLGVLHAFGHGVPVITQRAGNHGPEIQNIEHGRTGLLLESGLDAYADALLQLGTDRERAHRMGLKAYAHYSETRTIDGMAEGFRRAITGGEASRNDSR